MCNIINKRILLFCNNLGYSLFAKGIEGLAKENILSIVIRDDRYSTDLKSSGYSIYRIIKKMINYQFESLWVKEQLCEIGEKKYDYFVVIGYYQVKSSIIQKIRSNNPKCQCLIYFYDSFCRLNFSNDIIHFDKCYTFDREDALKYKINYLPFFVEKYRKCNGISYDLCHIGSWSPGHVYRFPLLLYIEKKAKEHFLKSYFRCTYQDISHFSTIKKIKYLFVAALNREYRLYWIFFKRYRNSAMLLTNRMNYSETVSYTHLTLPTNSRV